MNMEKWVPQLIVTIAAFVGVGLLVYSGKITGEGAIGLASIFAVGINAWLPGVNQPRN